MGAISASHSILNLTYRLSYKTTRENSWVQWLERSFHFQAARLANFNCCFVNFTDPVMVGSVGLDLGRRGGGLSKMISALWPLTNKNIGGGWITQREAPALAGTLKIKAKNAIANFRCGILTDIETVPDSSQGLLFHSRRAIQTSYSFGRTTTKIAPNRLNFAWLCQKAKGINRLVSAEILNLWILL